MVRPCVDSATSSDRKGSLKQTYGLVGDGRLARHLHRYFSLEGIPHHRWDRRTDGAETFNRFAGSCSLLLLAVSDQAIEPLAREAGPDKTLVHFSGALTTPLAYGCHPLMTFAHELYSLETYRKVPFFVEKGRGEFQKLFPTLQNPVYEIDVAKKALYHAFCVMSGNFTSFLWASFFEKLAGEFDIPPEAAVPYLRQVTENLARRPENPRDTWTGPIVRADQETIEKNLGALSDDPHRKIYQAFAEAYSRQAQGDPQQ